MPGGKNTASRPCVKVCQRPIVQKAQNPEDKNLLRKRNLTEISNVEEVQVLDLSDSDEGVKPPPKKVVSSFVKSKFAVLNEPDAKKQKVDEDMDDNTNKPTAHSTEQNISEEETETSSLQKSPAKVCKKTSSFIQQKKKKEENSISVGEKVSGVSFFNKEKSKKSSQDATTGSEVNQNDVDDIEQVQVQDVPQSGTATEVMEIDDDDTKSNEPINVPGIKKNLSHIKPDKPKSRPAAGSTKLIMTNKKDGKQISLQKVGLKPASDTASTIDIVEDSCDMTSSKSNPFSKMMDAANIGAKGSIYLHGVEKQRPPELVKVSEQAISKGDIKDNQVEHDVDDLEEAQETNIIAPQVEQVPQPKMSEPNQVISDKIIVPGLTDKELAENLKKPY